MRNNSKTNSQYKYSMNHFIFNKTYISIEVENHLMPFFTDSLRDKFLTDQKQIQYQNINVSKLNIDLCKFSWAFWRLTCLKYKHSSTKYFSKSYILHTYYIKLQPDFEL